jgi:hypothetical protein
VALEAFHSVALSEPSVRPAVVLLQPADIYCLSSVFFTLSKATNLHFFAAAAAAAAAIV